MIDRKFFTIVITLNAIGILLAGLKIWIYPWNYPGAMILGNLFAAILVRNEFFGRILYLIANTLFAKVSILRYHEKCSILTSCTVDPSVLQISHYLYSSASRRYPQWMRLIRLCMVHFPIGSIVHEPLGNAHRNPCHGYHDQPHCAH